MPLPDKAVVIPGHGDNTTIGREKQFNYFLQAIIEIHGWPSNAAYCRAG